MKIESLDEKSINLISQTNENEVIIKKSIFDKVRFALQFIVLLFGLIAVSKMIDYLSIEIEKNQPSNKMTFSSGGNDSTKSNRDLTQFFHCQGATEFEGVEYFGKANLFRQIISEMTKIIILTSKLSEKELSSKFKVTFRNFLFRGPPGTGKTQFVKSLVYKLNKNLKAKYKEETDKDLVGAIFITPSSLNDRWFGGTEQKIKNLFLEGRRGDYKAKIIFLDEVDAFFGIRSNDPIHEHLIQIKTEFLNILSGINEDLKSNLFVFGASNRYDNIDPAFLRRMGSHFEFGLPDKKEIKIILDEVTKDWVRNFESERLLSECASILASKNATQALITEIISRLTFGNDVKSVDLIQKFYDCISSSNEDDLKGLLELNFGNINVEEEYLFDKDL